MPQVFSPPEPRPVEPRSLDLSKLEQAADIQVSAADLGYAVDALVDGAYATDYYTGGDKIDLRIMAEDRFAKSSQIWRRSRSQRPPGSLFR